MTLRKLLIGAAILAIAVPAAAHARPSRSSGVNYQRLANRYLIDQIEVTWHKAASKKDLDLMMSLWAPNASFTIAGQTYRGKAAIRGVFAKAGPFQPQNHWESDTPAYKIRVTVDGNRGTLYFECHYVDVDTGKVAIEVGADQDVRKINGKWLITKAIASSVTLKP
jgi:ketosteroid isomerase-like protein